MPSRHWIFQAVPREFRIGDFVAANPATALWRVSNYGREMRPGDRVYLWHAKGRDGSPGKAGVIGRAVIAGPLARCADSSPAARHWEDPSDAAAVIDRIEIRFEGLSPKAVLGYDDLKTDPAFATHSIFRFSQGSNFRLDPVHADRLDDLWEHAGTALSDDERLAALTAAAERRDPAWLAGMLPRTASRCARAIWAAEPAKAAALGLPPGAAEQALWQRYLGAGGAGRDALREDFERAWPDRAAALPVPQDGRGVVAGGCRP